MGFYILGAHGLVVGVTNTGVGTPGVGVAVAEGIGLANGGTVGNTRVGKGVGSSGLEKAPGPTRLATKLTTMMILKTLMIILALRLLRRLYLDRLTLSSRTLLLYGDIIPCPLQADNYLLPFTSLGLDSLRSQIQAISARYGGVRPRHHRIWQSGGSR